MHARAARDRARPCGQWLGQENGLPLNETLTSILLASCNDEELDSPTLAQLVREDADLFLMIGDNVYGDRDGRDYANNQPELDELREEVDTLRRELESSDGQED